MTTYPLSEPSTIYRAARPGNDGDSAAGIVARGSLADCAEILEGWSAAERAEVRVEVDEMNLTYGAPEIEELLDFLREEAAAGPDKSVTLGTLR
jgi:hypothetical protein